MKLQIIPISHIWEGSRRRIDYGDLDELADSIKQNGLINPIAVGLSKNYENFDGNSDETPFVLLAGGRRYRACVLCNLNSVPVRIYERKLTNFELRSIELEENIRRKELTWDERIKLIEEVHSLQVQIHGEKVSTSPNATGHSMRDTAALIGKSHASVSLDLKLSRAMKQHPELGWEKCKNKNEANKLLKKASKIIENKILSSQAKKTLGTSTRLVRRLVDSYVVTDCFKAMQNIESNTFDFAEVDPPYGIELGKVKRNNKCHGYNEIAPEQYEEFLAKLCPELYRILVPDSWLVFWFAPEPWFESVYQALASAGFKTKRMCGEWRKPGGQTNSPETNLANSTEMFFYARKGNAKLQKPGRSNVFDFVPVNSANKIHPTERPIELIQEILKTFAKPNARIVVPFAGSGKTLLAAALEGMLAVGYDLSQEYKDSYIVQVKKLFGES